MLACPQMRLIRSKEDRTYARYADGQHKRISKTLVRPQQPYAAGKAFRSEDCAGTSEAAAAFSSSLFPERALAVLARAGDRN
jgi:hypothetical protein